MHHILVIDDDEFILSLLVTVLKKAGYHVSSVRSGEEGLHLIERDPPDLVLTDYKMPGISGLEVVNELTRSKPGLPVIMLTGYGDVSLTVKAIQAGAYDFIEKPIKNRELLESIKNGIYASIQSQSLKSVIAPHARKAIEENLLAGKTQVMREIFKNIGRISLNKVNVIITGEAGTGKEQIARLIHYSGITRNDPFVSVNCNAVDEEQLEHELFGFASSAPERRNKDLKGKLELAKEGTVYLDGITHLNLQIQNKLLRVLQTGKIEIPGSPASTPFEARIIAATNKNINNLIEKGQFLSELYFQIKIFSLHIPPLRERKEDIPELLQILLQRLNKKLNKKVVKIDDGVFDLLREYNWPGNIRELENILVQALVLTHGDVLERKNILIATNQSNTAKSNDEPLLSLHEIEKKHIRKVLDATGWNKMEASGILQISRPTLNAKIEKYQLIFGKKS